MKHSGRILFVLFIFCFFGVQGAMAQVDLRTRFLKVHLDEKGYITNLNGKTNGSDREFCSGTNRSPLLALYNFERKEYYYPRSAQYKEGNLILGFSNGSKALVKVERRDLYLKFTLLSLSPRSGVTDVQWGALHTTIDNLFGEMIGVARDTSARVNFAIGLMALNDATTGGPASSQGDISPFEYVIHSPGKAKYPLPDTLKEGRYFSIGGNGISDVAFYSHPEEYYRIVYGNSAGVDESGRIFLVSHAADRTRPRDIYYSLMPKMEANKPVHQQRQAIPGVDFIGSSVALWGSPDSLALMLVIKDIVKAEKLPYPTLDGKWVKDPAAYRPDVLWVGGKYDSAVSYTSQLGFKAIEGWNLGEFYPNRSDGGNISLTMPFASGRKPVREFTDVSNKAGVAFGLHTLNCFLQRNVSSDVSPLPNDSLDYLQKRILKKDLSENDTVIVLNDTTYLNEIAGWEGHPDDANVIRIGKELIYYNGVSETYPYSLRHVKRGYWGTRAGAHRVGDDVFKLETNCYHGFVPDLFLQDEYADYYADLCKWTGMRYIDFDGEEDLFYQGHGEYSVKRFYRRLFNRAEQDGLGLIRVTGATLSGGSWHYHSVWNVGGGDHLYNMQTRTWGIEGKDLRNVTYANYFPSTFGGNFEMNRNSRVQDYENVQALSVGLGVTYVMSLSEKSVESCPNKQAIFQAIRTWEHARSADAFPSAIKKKLADVSNYFHLEQIDSDHWNLYMVNKEGAEPQLVAQLTRSRNSGK